MLTIGHIVVCWILIVGIVISKIILRSRKG